MEEKAKSAAGEEKKNSEIDNELSNLMSKSSKSPVRSIESPKYGLGLSPIQKFMTVHSPTLSPAAQRRDFNIDT